MYVEKQFVRDIELYRNTPLELKLGGNNPTKGFSFNVRKDGDSTFVLSDFRIGRDKIKEKVQGNVPSSDTQFRQVEERHPHIMGKPDGAC